MVHHECGGISWTTWCGPGDVSLLDVDADSDMDIIIKTEYMNMQVVLYEDGQWSLGIEFSVSHMTRYSSTFLKAGFLIPSSKGLDVIMDSSTDAAGFLGEASRGVAVYRNFDDGDKWLAFGALGDITGLAIANINDGKKSEVAVLVDSHDVDVKGKAPPRLLWLEPTSDTHTPATLQVALWAVVGMAAGLVLIPIGMFLVFSKRFGMVSTAVWHKLEEQNEDGKPLPEHYAPKWNAKLGAVLNAFFVLAFVTCAAVGCVYRPWRTSALVMIVISLAFSVPLSVAVQVHDLSPETASKCCVWFGPKAKRGVLLAILCTLGLAVPPALGYRTVEYCWDSTEETCPSHTEFSIVVSALVLFYFALLCWFIHLCYELRATLLA
eukprot:TRINITY_DN882_c0_g2_i1.p1 TRINITY_DN882_c0_g2~~TRINITY_DN882_c0_g2_i1.p1  ORF type:complete len:379 (-),score=80.28 TRINITY_DN882_c0_g2_i1:753-1889(-)